MRAVLISILLISGSFTFGQQKQVCFTFDDLPFVTYGIPGSTNQKEGFDKIVAVLKTNKIPAIGFVNGGKLYARGKLQSSKMDLLINWFNSGLELGNHTFSHSDYNNVPFSVYKKDILDCEHTLKRVLDEPRKPITYFRHTYLHVGNSKAKADSLDNFLKENNYQVAPVTIDNEDYLFASAYSKVSEKQDTALMKQIGLDYLAYMNKKLIYYEMQSRILFGRCIPQILLLHMSTLNSDYLEALIDLFRENKYEFVNISDALKDPAYQTKISVYGNWGISWIDKWALSAGKKGDFFKADPVTPDYIKVLAE
jgi:peptidoglycan/xylan/chitin deacetylase (PgdA/CDA1 family)